MVLSKFQLLRSEVRLIMKPQYPFYDVEYELNTVKDVIDIVLISYKDNPVFIYKKGEI